MNILKKTCFGAVLSVTAIFSAAGAASADGVFLCMRPEDTVAVTADENKYFKYIDMTASNGAAVSAQISVDGNTYLPLRFICESAGLADCGGTEGDLPDNSFRYVPAGNGYPDRIELKINGTYYTHNIGEEFTYEPSPGDVRTVAVYNIRGSLYMPMGYLAKITGSQAIWQADTGSVMFISGSLSAGDYIMENGRLRRDKEMILGYDFFANNLCGSPLYLKTDGITVSDIGAETGVSASCASRVSGTVYFIDGDGYICVSQEGSGVYERLAFTDQFGTEVMITAENAAAVRGKLYGIEKGGKLFCAELDGSGFRYLTDKNVFNMFIKKDGSDYYLFYGEADPGSVMHMINMRTMDDYTMEITDYSHNNLLEGMQSFVVGKTNTAYIDIDGRIHVINTVRNPEEIEILRVMPSNHMIFENDSAGEAISSAAYLNYDYINDVIYAVTDTGDIYYYEKNSQQMVKFDICEGMSTFSLFSDAGYRDMFAANWNGGIYSRYTKYTGDGVWYND